MPFCPNSPKEKDNLWCIQYSFALQMQTLNLEDKHGINLTWEIILCYIEVVLHASYCSIQVKGNTNRLLGRSQGQPQLLNGGGIYSREGEKSGDFYNQPLSVVWPLNTVPLNTGLIVCTFDLAAKDTMVRCCNFLNCVAVKAGNKLAFSETEQWILTLNKK